MKKIIASAAVLLMLGACSPYTADLSFVRAQGLGFRNAGLYDAGQLFIWNTATKRLVPLQDDIPLQKISSSRPPTDLKSTRVQGVSIAGEFGTASEKISAEAALGQKVSFVAEQAVRERYQAVYTAMAKAYNDGIAQNRDMKNEWRLDDVMRRSSGQYYVLVTNIVRADKAVISYGGMDSDELGKLSVTVPGQLGTIKVAVRGSNAAECAGKASPCFFDVMVLSPYLTEAKTLAFKQVDANPTQLIEAFRAQ